MPTITPASRVTAPTTPATSTDERRFYGRADGPVQVVLDSNGSEGSFTADVALDSFKPLLTRAQFDGLAMRVSLPPNEAGTLPATIVEKNGRAFLRVAVDKAQVSMLTASPMAIVVGKAERLGKTSAPDFTLQVNADALKVDRSAPTLRMELEARGQDVRAVEFAKSDLAGLRDGSSGWFGGRQLETEHAGLVTRVAETRQAVETSRADLEQRLTAADHTTRLLSMPPELGNRDEFFKLHNATIGDKQALISARELRQSFVELDIADELPAQDAKIAELEAKVAVGVNAENDVRARYAAARENTPALADAWLARLSQLQGLPNFNATIASAARAEEALALNESDRARIAENNAKNLPAALAQAEAVLSRMTRQLTATDQRIEGLRDGSRPDIVTTAPTHAADMKVI